jgi:hypothetical protein
MRRHDYLQLRAEQIDAYPNVSSWDTAPLPRLQAVEETLFHRLASDMGQLAACPAVRMSDRTEISISGRNTSRQLLYLRALRYLREHGIAPDWPLHSRASRQSGPRPRELTGISEAQASSRERPQAMAAAGNVLCTRMCAFGHTPRLTVDKGTSGWLRAVCTQCGALGELLLVKGDQMPSRVMRGAATTSRCSTAILMAAQCRPPWTQRNP